MRAGPCSAPQLAVIPRRPRCRSNSIQQEIQWQRKFPQLFFLFPVCSRSDGVFLLLVTAQPGVVFNHFGSCDSQATKEITLNTINVSSQNSLETWNGCFPILKINSRLILKSQDGFPLIWASDTFGFCHHGIIFINFHTPAPPEQFPDPLLLPLFASVTIWLLSLTFSILLHWSTVEKMPQSETLASTPCRSSLWPHFQIGQHQGESMPRCPHWLGELLAREHSESIKYCGVQAAVSTGPKYIRMTCWEGSKITSDSPGEVLRKIGT